MNGHPQFEEDFDLYALGALDPEEKLGIESHLKRCAACLGKLAAAHGRIAMLGLAAPAADPPLHLKQRLMIRVQEQARVPAAKSRSWFQAFWGRPAAAWGLAALTTVAAIILAASNYRLHQEILKFHAEAQVQQVAIARARTVFELLTAPDTQAITLTSAPEKRPAGRVYYHPNRGLLFYATNLPVPPTGREYQLWLVPAEGSPISAGVFEPDRKGDASIVLPKLPPGVKAKAFAVTLEPRGGVSQPTGPKVLVGS